MSCQMRKLTFSIKKTKMILCPSSISSILKTPAFVEQEELSCDNWLFKFIFSTLSAEFWWEVHTFPSFPCPWAGLSKHCYSCIFRWFLFCYALGEKRKQDNNNHLPLLFVCYVPNRSGTSLQPGNMLTIFSFNFLFIQLKEILCRGEWKTTQHFSTNFYSSFFTLKRCLWFFYW